MTHTATSVSTRPHPRSRPVRASAARLRHRTGGQRRRQRGHPWWSLAFLAPTIIAFGFFSWWPIVGTVTLSLQETNLVQPAVWTGTRNFTRVLEDPLLGQAALNTLWFTVLTLAFVVPGGIIIAVLLSELRRLGGLYRTLVYLPAVVPPVVGVLLWKYFYNPDSGLFNAVLGSIGLGPFPWLQDSSSALPSLVFQHVWASIGGTVLIYLAALTAVERQLYEAAEIDGASIAQRMWHVTLPQMRGIILIMLLLQLLGTFQIFTEPYVMTNGGPANSTITVLLLIYRYAFSYGEYGMAAALSLILAVVLCVVSAIYLWATRKWSTK